MIQFKIKTHSGAMTIEFPCEDCGKINIRCFGVHIQKEIHEKICWSCSKKQPALLDLVFNRTNRVQYYFSNKTQSVVSGIY